MKILAIHDGHNATACYLCDGEIISMVSEERFTNKKNQGGFPQNAIKWILDKNSLTMGDFDYIAIPHLISPIDYTKSYGQYAPSRVLFMVASTLLPHFIIGSNKMIKPYLALFGPHRRSKLKEYSKKYGFSLKKLRQVEHHSAHGYAALYGSGFHKNNEPVLIFTSDNSGDGLASSVAVWDKKCLYRRIQRTQSFHSLGEIYSRVTQYLGMKAGEHEYKIMGMAPYVYEEYSNNVFKKLLNYIHFEPSNGKMINEKYFGYQILWCMKKDFFCERFDNICAGNQRHFENVIINWVKYWAKQTGIRNAVFGGGSFMNVKANMLITQLDEFDKVFFCPSSGDESTALGAAYKIAEEKEEPNIKPVVNLCKGPDFSNHYIQKKLDQYKDKITWEKYSDIEKKTSELLADGNIVARFKGASEWGARALGGRSILCRADDLKIIHKLNKSIKMRDFWMPFAASILEEDADEYIINPKRIPAPFMVLSFKTTPKAQEEIPAALHPFDKTCRPQLVSREASPSYHKLLKYFKNITGLCGLLNTSFNLHGYPIVSTPGVAVDTLINSKLDYLTLEDYLITPKPNVQPKIT